MVIAIIWTSMIWNYEEGGDHRILAISRCALSPNKVNLYGVLQNRVLPVSTVPNQIYHSDEEYDSMAELYRPHASHNNLLPVILSLVCGLSCISVKYRKRPIIFCGRSITSILNVQCITELWTRDASVSTCNYNPWSCRVSSSGLSWSAICCKGWDGNAGKRKIIFSEHEPRFNIWTVFSSCFMTECQLI